MTLFSRAVELPPDAFELARALTPFPGVVLAWGDGGATAYVSCDPSAVSHSLDPEPTLPRIAARDAEVPRWFGCVPYEACRQLEEPALRDQRSEPLLMEPLWLRYAAVARIRGACVEVLGDDEEAVARLCGRLRAAPDRGPVEVRFRRPPEPRALHVQRIRCALEQIARGNVYEVNLARCFELSVSATPWDLLSQWCAGGIPPQAMAWRWGDLDVIAASPELCLALEPGGRVLTRPIKGTRPRHADPIEDARLARELDADPKERAELTMILDVERNDLGRVARVGTVRLLTPPQVVAWPDVHHRLATLEAFIDDSVSRAELLGAMLPSGSVTGAPKRRAMQLIAELEPMRRGLYTGVVGYLQHDGGLQLSMAIRTLTVRRGLGHYYSGGGIVADSDPQREVEETVWKAQRLLGLMGESARAAEN